MEQAHQDRFLFLRLRHQKPFKLPLRQDHDLAELLAGKPDQLLRFLFQIFCFRVLKKRNPYARFIQKCRRLFRQIFQIAAALFPDAQAAGKAVTL